MNAARYSAVAITLHWLIAAAVIANIALGIWMHDAIDVADSRAMAVQAYQLHKSLGFSVLVLTGLRLAWRLTHTPPLLPAGMTQRQQLLASIVHKAFYVLMVFVPLSGWLLVSIQWRGDSALNVDTVLFDQITVPHLFDLHRQSTEVRQQTAAVVVNVHWVLAISMGLLVIVHIGAALMHQFRYRDQLLLRMAFLPREHRSCRHRVAQWLGLLVTVGVLTVGLQYGLRVLQPQLGQADTSAEVISSAVGGWSVLPESSAIRFSGAHAGSPFAGRFLRWKIDARLRPDQMAASQIIVIVETDSARDGNPLHDRTLPEGEWFDVENYPTARFEMTRIEARAKDEYAMAGELFLKDRRVPVENLLLTLGQDTARITGEVLINRKQANMGLESDPGGKWVSLEIRVAVDVVLRAISG